MQKFKAKNLFKLSFTLLEMLVVLGIISTIIGFSFASYTTAQKKARDSRRKQDLKAIQNILEQYYSICKFRYPLISGSLPQSLQAKIEDGCEYTTEVFKIPNDPLGGSYQCLNCNQQSYTLCPPDLGNGNFSETDNCNSTNLACCVSNQQ